MNSNYKPTLTWVTLGLAVLLLISPWVFAYPAVTIPNAVIGAVLVGAASIMAIVLQRRGSGSWLNYVLLNLVLGGWVFISPLLFHFNDADPATWIQMLGGAAITFLAAREVWQSAALPRVAKMAG